MMVIEDLNNFKPPNNPVVTSGTFDGVHLGHQKILKRVVNLAKDINGTSVVLTFWPHPRFVLHKDASSLKLLNSFEEKCDILSELHIDYVVKIPFTKSFSQLTSLEFIDKILVKSLQTKVLVIGYDHRFGKHREGSFDYLLSNSHHFGFNIEEIPRLDVDHIGVSSTKIREFLTAGDVDHAKDYLGRFYSLRGQIIKGSQRGREIGFPTANIKIHERFKLIPKDGTYAVLINLDGEQHKGMLNIGFRPTVDGSERTIEVHIFDFRQNIYEKNIEVVFVKRLREERKFADLKSLKNQLSLDRENAVAELNQSMNDK